MFNIVAGALCIITRCRTCLLDILFSLGSLQCLLKLLAQRLRTHFSRDTLVQVNLVTFLSVIWTTVTILARTLHPVISESVTSVLPIALWLTLVIVTVLTRLFFVLSLLNFLLPYLVCTYVFFDISNLYRVIHNVTRVFLDALLIVLNVTLHSLRSTTCFSLGAAEEARELTFGRDADS